LRTWIVRQSSSKRCLAKILKALTRAITNSHKFIGKISAVNCRWNGKSHIYETASWSQFERKVISDLALIIAYESGHAEVGNINWTLEWDQDLEL
jgi:hypothetical protein